MRGGLPAALVLASLLAACAEHNFSQYPGFAEYYRANPRGSQPADAAARRLLERHRPRLFVAAGAEGPLDFYADYIAQGALYDGTGRLLGGSVDRALLNRHREDPRVVFVHRRRAGPVTPTALARLDRATLPGLGELHFLTYHFAFRNSGLPAGLPVWQRRLLAALADAEDWHQLDHYTAASLVLDAEQRPLALLLQQHNYLRSYIFGHDLDWPADGRVPLVAALGSNELYPYRPGVNRYRAVSHMDVQSLHYLVRAAHAPWLNGDDITRAEREVPLALAYLPPDDAFYAFAGYLGERRRLPGRDGPPGADYNALPALKPLVLQLVAFHWREGDVAQMRLLERLLDAVDRGDLRGLAHARAALTARFVELLRGLP